MPTLETLEQWQQARIAHLEAFQALIADKQREIDNLKAAGEPSEPVVYKLALVR